MKEKHKNLIVICVMAALLIGMTLFCWLKKHDDYSDSERRALAKFPELTVETIKDGSFMEDFESYTADQFPARDTFRGVKSFSELMVLQKLDNNGLYIKDGYISKNEYPYNQSMLDHAGERFQFIYDSFLENKVANVYFSIVPDKNYFLAQDSNRLSLDYEKLVSEMREKTDYMTYIDIFPLLQLKDYYKTDTHWRQEEILDVAEKLAEEMGAGFNNDYTVNKLETPFYGVYCGQIALPVTPDTIKYLTSETLDSCKVTSYNTGMPVETTIYNMEKAEGKDAYEMFLSGADPLIVIENSNAKADKELVIFRDSFGSSIAPLMVEGYSKITLVDIRYVQSAMLGKLVDFNENQDVLFLYSTLLLNNSLAMK